MHREPHLLNWEEKGTKKDKGEEHDARMLAKTSPTPFSHLKCNLQVFNKETCFKKVI